MEGIQKNIDSIQKKMIELQLATGIQTNVVVKTTKEEDAYYFSIMIDIDDEFQYAVEDASFESAMCYLSALMIGYDMAVDSLFKKTHSN